LENQLGHWQGAKNRVSKPGNYQSQSYGDPAQLDELVGVFLEAVMQRQC